MAIKYCIMLCKCLLLFCKRSVKMDASSKEANDTN